MPSDNVGSRVEGLGRPQPSSSPAAPAWQEDGAVALVAQLERDEEMARALAAEDTALARRQQVPTR